MKHLICFLFLVTCSQLGFGQMLDNRECKVFTEDPFFNTQFIAQNKVKSMHGTLSTKKEMDLIRKGYLEYQYTFDRRGRLSSQFSAFGKPSNRIDTIVLSYDYSIDNLVTRRRKNDVHGFFSYDYEYEGANRSKETYYRDENVGPSKNQFELGRRFIITSESFTYEKFSDKQEKRKFYNNYGRVYKEEITYYNDLGYKVEIESRFIITNKRSNIKFEYDEKGRVSKRTEKYDITKPSNYVSTYAYDEVGNLIEENKYRDGKHVSIEQFLYDGRMLISASVSKDIPTNLITIIKYDYTFYE